MTAYSQKPDRFLERLHFSSDSSPIETLCCAGFQLEAWRCKPFARHLIEWLPDYALTEDELQLHHGDAYDKICQAAVRVYTSDKYQNRGEAGEIALHAICREFFGTIPISPRVFYKSASNDVVKAFDMVHARIVDESVEVWLGEAKLYQNRAAAIAEAIRSVQKHLSEGFLTNQKLLIGPQIPKSVPEYAKLRRLFASQARIDRLLESAVIAIGIVCDSEAVAATKGGAPPYVETVINELREMLAEVRSAPLSQSVRVKLIYVPLLSKVNLVAAFDKRLKGLQDDD
ncbi:MAG: DUF1837 domain-containing protein [Proteobacteria bacterium]|nr:MAG: DUF1837 domain-containing protein [Pseudomonadota bacterium]